MSASRKARRDARESATPGAGRQLSRAQAALPLLAVVALLGLLWRTGRRDGLQAPPAPATSAPPLAAAESPGRFHRLVGRWMRVDGGYVLEIRGVDAGGRLDAAYLNPRPIRVARAQASLDGGAAELLIELRDVNYPGSTYRLRYDAGRDVLSGTYFQAVEKQMYDVSFMRR